MTLKDIHDSHVNLGLQECPLYEQLKFKNHKLS